jgi:ferritin-like metal-binding protein YciE
MSVRRAAAELSAGWNGARNATVRAEATMASVGSLREHLVAELQDLVNAEEQLIEALPQMEKRASRRELKSAFRSHLAETRRHAQRAARALKMLDEDPSGETCEAMEGLLEEGQELMGSADPGSLLDAMMITAAQKVEHYEIASYGTVRTYARVLGQRAIAKLMSDTLKEEKAADRKLTRIAEGDVNRRAAREWHEQEGMLARGAKWVGSAVGSVSRTVMPRSTAAERQKPRRGPKRGRAGRGQSRRRRR